MYCYCYHHHALNLWSFLLWDTKSDGINCLRVLTWHSKAALAENKTAEKNDLRAVICLVMCSRIHVNSTAVFYEINQKNTAWKHLHILTRLVWFPGEVDHGGAVLRPHPPPRGGHCQAVCGCVHRLDDGPGVAQGLNASAGCQGAKYVCPDHPQTSLQCFCTKVCQKCSQFSCYL